MNEVWFGWYEVVSFFFKVVRGRVEYGVGVLKIEFWVKVVDKEGIVWNVVVKNKN